MARVGGIASLLVCLSCHPRSGDDKSQTGDRQGQIVADASSDNVRPLRFARPIAAARMDDGIAVVARDRSTAELAFVAFDDRGTAVVTHAALPVNLDDPQLLVSSADVAVLARAPADGATGRVSFRVALGPDGGATVIESEPVGDAACSTLDGVYSLERNGGGWQGTFRSLTLARGERDGPKMAEGSEATIVCGRHRAFAVLAAKGELHVLGWSPEAHDVAAITLPREDISDSNDNALLAAGGDELVVAKIEKSTLATLVSRNGQRATWRSTDVGADDLTLEAIEPGDGFIGLVFIRTIARAKGCIGSEKTDAVVEVAVADTASGKLVRAPQAVETWRCGAEPGPFFSGWAGGKLVVAWPRGPDSACDKAGLRRGGIGFAEVATNGALHVARLARPADAIAGAGCDERKCYAVALTRGADPCGPVDGPDAGRLEVIAYPP